MNTFYAHFDSKTVKNGYTIYIFTDLCKKGGEYIAEEIILKCKGSGRDFNYKDLVFFKTFYDFQHVNRTAEIAITHVNLEEVKNETYRCH